MPIFNPKMAFTQNILENRENSVGTPVSLNEIEGCTRAGFSHIQIIGYFFKSLLYIYLFVFV